jgi:hypothetical protein
MNHELICNWLGLADASWPPDHYRLLGLEPGESDVGRIEEQVHQRLESVRRYQLTHPELVTEAMNRLAQAFVCLTDSAAKRAYDIELLGAEAVKEEGPPVALQEAPPSLAWLHNAPEELVPVDTDSDAEGNQRNGAASEENAESVAELPAVPLLPAEPVESSAAVPAESLPPAALQAQTPTTLATPDADPTPPDIVIPEGLPGAAISPPEKPDPLAEAASASHARRGLGTKRALYYRIARTRKLLTAWEQAGKYLAQPQRRVTRPVEATELIRLLARIQSLLRGFPPVLGEAGQPGYLVVALARQATPVPTFQTLLPSQREALAQHWEAGHKLLTAHRQFLRQEARARRRRGRLSRAARVFAAFVSDYPEYVLFALALLAITFAIARL